MKKIDIGFLGYGTRALDALMADDRYNVKYFLTPGSRLCDEVYEAADKYKDRVDMEIISTKRELTERMAQINDVACFLMNACPFILTDEILDHMDVYNIHPGSLLTNRGHQPHLWTVLLDERETEICLHKVSAEIDLGYVIEDIKINLTGKENSLEVLNKAEDKIPLLLDGLYDYLTGKRDVRFYVKDGIYRNIMDYSDYEIKQEDTLEDIDRKIRTRYMHNGAFFIKEGKRIYVDKILNLEKCSGNALEYNSTQAQYCKNGLKITFHVKKITDLSDDPAENK